MLGQVSLAHSLYTDSFHSLVDCAHCSAVHSRGLRTFVAWLLRVSTLLALLVLDIDPFQFGDSEASCVQPCSVVSVVSV